LGNPIVRPQQVCHTLGRGAGQPFFSAGADAIGPLEDVGVTPLLVDDQGNVRVCDAMGICRVGVFPSEMRRL
jgi:hypothetical protein